MMSTNGSGGVFGGPTGAAWLALVAAGLTMEAIEKVRDAVEALGDDAHRVFSLVLPHLVVSAHNPDPDFDPHNRRG